MSEPALALALSARNWADELHRFLADHGGARVRVTAVGPEDLYGESFDVLLIDDICSFLTPRLVSLVTSMGRAVIGVFDPEEFADGKQRLIECGVSDVIETSAHPDEFLRAIGRLALTVEASVPAATLVQPPSTGSSPRPARIIVVGGPSGGVGATEVAIGISQRIADAGERVALIDADDHAPAVAQRLGIPLHPNLLTALDVLEHRNGSLPTVFQSIGRRSFFVLAGLAAGADWSDVRPRRVVDLARYSADLFDRIVINIGSQIEPVGYGESGGRFATARAVLGVADRVVAVGHGSPMGLARLLDWISRAGAVSESQIHVVLNDVPTDKHRQAELVQELARTYRPGSLVLLPHDSAVQQAAWNGDPVTRGRWKRSLDRWFERSFGGAA